MCLKLVTLVRVTHLGNGPRDTHRVRGCSPADFVIEALSLSTSLVEIVLSVGELSSG